MNEPKIIYDHLPDGHLGLSDGKRYIWIDRDQSPASARVAIEHELVHMHHGDSDHCAPEIERRINELVARGIIHLQDLGDAAAWSEHLYVVAEELSVRPQTIELRLRLLTDRERAELAERLADAHWAP